jgi:5-methylcytosine-specific restriction protein B
MIKECITQFIEQARTDNIRIKDYPKYYKGCKVAVSFGKGRVSNVPWIAYLLGNNEVRKGIYPAILYFKNYNLLITAYAVSDYFNDDNTKWVFPKYNNIKTIGQTIDNIPLSKLSYRNSFVNDVFYLDNEIDYDSIQRSIDYVIEFYKNIYG